MEENNKKVVNNFTDLLAYKNAHNLTLDIYRISKSFPREEVFGLTNQIRRASVSVVSNIAEGFSRMTARDKANFYGIARGSLSEVHAQILITRDLGYVNDSDLKKFAADICLTGKLISGLIKSAKSY